MRDIGSWFREQLGGRVQKLSVSSGLSCPNRDGSLGTGGCTFCLNRAFTPSYADPSLSIGRQLEAGKQFFANKTAGKQVPAHSKTATPRYLAYFQSYSNTYAPLPELERIYEEALSVPDVAGLVIATRPDCITPALLDYLERLSRRTFLLIEYGIESANDDTLRRIHRGHTFKQSQQAVRLTAERGIHVGGHVILGFPWEDRPELMRQADLIAQLPLTTLKLHQLQIIRGTEMARQYEAAPWPMPTAQEYADLVVEYVSHLPQSLILDRFVCQSPPEMVIAPRWGIKSSEFDKLLHLQPDSMTTPSLSNNP
ncbi:MAG: TIGR01212 family radical SAM protein [Bacteroidaceae bacterium]|nr:TIGR01212 family radical SAM protein [Bacteroidaceae bacterium]